MVAGDIFSYLKLDDSHLAFYHIDVAGHGVRSAMLSFTLSKVLSASVRGRQPGQAARPGRSPGGDLHHHTRRSRRLNSTAAFQDKDEATPYFTMIYGVVNTAIRPRADVPGRPPESVPRLARRHASRSLGSGGFPVGLLPNAAVREH